MNRGRTILRTEADKLGMGKEFLRTKGKYQCTDVKILGTEEK